MSQEEIYIANFVSNLNFQGLNGDLAKWPELGRNPNSGHFDLIPATACYQFPEIKIYPKLTPTKNSIFCFLIPENLKCFGKYICPIKLLEYSTLLAYK